MPAKNPSSGKVIDLTDHRNTIYYYELRFYDKSRTINKVLHWLDDMHRNPEKIAFEKERVIEKYSDYELSFDPVIITMMPRRKLKAAVRKAVRKQRESTEEK